MAIDSQSVKIMQFIGAETGIDTNKKVNGRKRTILVDTLGIPWAVKVGAASESDNQSGIRAIELLKGKVPRLQKIIADQGYKTTFIEHTESTHGWKVEIAPLRRAAKTRISEGLCPPEEPLAGGKIIWLA